MGKRGRVAGIGVAALFVSACAASGGGQNYGGGPSGGSFQGGSSSGAGVEFPPSFGATVHTATPPPPISGGTMIALADGKTAVVADPDRDQVYIVDVAERSVTFTVPLQAGDEPGRLVEDGAGDVQVVLRGGGALVTIDPSTGTILGRRPVCPAPRGVAWRPSDDAVLVACATGELVTLPVAGGPATSSVVVQRDLRDVLVVGGQVVVSTFRSAQLLWVAADGSVTRTVGLPANGGDARVAWRTVANASGDLVVVHQLHSIEEVDTTQPSSYGGGASSIVQTGVTTVSPDGVITSDALLPTAVLPVDEALSPDGSMLYVAAAGNAFAPELTPIAATVPEGGSGMGAVGGQLPSGQVTAVAFDAAGDALAFVREPAALWIEPAGASDFEPVALSAVSRDDTGHDIFHAQAGALIACASCHPEGGDDGHIWDLDGNERRTPSLRGTIAGTAPYHWPGDMKNLDALVDQVYVQRMSGMQLDPEQMSVLEGWVQGIPAPPAPSWVDAAAAARGKALFEGDQAGCSTCHSGDKLTNNMTVSVGTGGAFQVPPLVGVGWRTPLLHDGCAPTVADRFGACATPQHGSTAGLSTQDVSDLVAYLDSL